MATKWFLEADYLQACNCDFGCPCEFEAPPTMGFCEGAGVWRINRGSFGDLGLEGLAFGYAAHWPKAIHHGNGTAVVYIDERATRAQRDALTQIATAQHGGMPFEIIVTTITNLLPLQFVPIQFNLDGRSSSVTVGGIVKIGLTPIKNPVTGSTESVRVEHQTGFIFKSAEAVEGAICDVNLEGLKFSWPHKAGFVANIRYSNG